MARHRYRSKETTWDKIVEFLVGIFLFWLFAIDKPSEIINAVKSGEVSLLHLSKGELALLAFSVFLWLGLIGFIIELIEKQKLGYLPWVVLAFIAYDIGIAYPVRMIPKLISGEYQFKGPVILSFAECLVCWVLLIWYIAKKNQRVQTENVHSGCCHEWSGL